MNSDNGTKRTKITLEGFNKDEVKELIELIKSISKRSTPGDVRLIRSLCGLSIEGLVWQFLWENGPHRFTDILNHVDCSKSKLSNVLKYLQMAILVRERYNLYEVIVPDWLVVHTTDETHLKPSDNT